MANEFRQSPTICIVNCPNDTLFKQLATSMKNVFPQNHILCPIKASIDLAARAKPPVVKIPTTDISAFPANLIPQVVSNYIISQTKKPAAKQPAKKVPPKKNAGKSPTSVEETPRQEPEQQGPIFAYITDYPKTIEQMNQLSNSVSPAICFINVETPQQPTDTSRKGNQQSTIQSTVDWKSEFESSLPFFSINLTSTTQTPDDACSELFKQVQEVYELYQRYRTEFLDYRFIKIPSFPPEIPKLPQIAPEKVGKAAPASKTQPMASSPIVQPPTTGISNPFLQKAFSITLNNQLENYLRNCEQPFSNQFQHAAELSPNYPLPASLAVILSHKPSERDRKLFRMRGLSYRTKMNYEMIENTLMVKKFEKLIGYSVGERRHFESIPIDFIPNVLAPLLSYYGTYKYIDFSGKILLAFYHQIPDDFPISEYQETYKLPLEMGFGKWFTNQSINPQGEQKTVVSVLQGEPAQTNSIGINVGHNDMFSGFVEDTTFTSVSRYFDESGLRVDTYPAELKNDMLSSLFFNVIFGSNSSPKFAFKISQKLSESDKNKNEEEEDEDTINTIMTIKSVLGHDTQCLLDFEADKGEITIVLKKATVSFDVFNNRTVMFSQSMLNKEKEVKRVVTFSGDLIKYLKDGQIIIYKPDGSIQTSLPNNEWRLVDSQGHSYLKRKGQWFKDMDHDETLSVAETYFAPRKVTNCSNGVIFIEDNNDLTIRYPDGTNYDQKKGVFTHPLLPDITVRNSTVSLETGEFVSNFIGETGDFSLETKNGSISLDFKKEQMNILIQYGQAKKAISMIDLYTGLVAHVGTNRLVYYLNEEFQWQLGRQNCSRKEILQHFQDNDFIQIITPVDKMDRETELMPIIANGHKPRLFVIEREQRDLTASISIKELLAASDFQSIMEASSSRISKKEDTNVTLWFDTEPKSYREITISPKITDEQKEEVLNGMKEQKEMENNRLNILASVGDPKWMEIEAAQKKEEEEIQALLDKYNVKLNA